MLPETARDARRSAPSPGAVERRGAALLRRAAGGPHRAARPPADLRPGAPSRRRPGRRVRERPARDRGRSDGTVLKLVFERRSGRERSAKRAARAVGALAPAQPLAAQVAPRTSTATTTSATTSTRSGSTSAWPTPARTSRRPTASLEEAQLAKMDHVARKVLAASGRARGRGGLRLGLARAAHGPPLRRARDGVQHLLASRSPARASAPAREGLSDRVEFRQDDYRNIARQLRRVRLGRHARARRRRELPRRSAA